MTVKPHDRMRVLLIAPTALDYSGNPITERRLHLPCLTLPQLAAATPGDVDVRLVYETVEEIPFDAHWDLVGLTGMGSGVVRAWQIADQFRARGVSVVIGGIAASGGRPDWSLDHADALVLGEADEIWSQVVADWQRGELKSQYQATTPPDLAVLPVPRYDLMNRRRMGLWLPVQATRGCPHACTFCSVTSFFRGTHRVRPVETVLRDVREAKQLRCRHIAFIDDNIAADGEYCRTLWEALIAEKVTWMSQCSISLAESPELLRLAYRSGCRLVSIGIESTNPDSLESIHKGWNRPSRYAEAIRAFRRHGIEVSTEMIVGFDTDNESVFKEAWEFIMGQRIAVPRVHILTPVPGTPLYDDLEAQGRIVSHDFSNYTGSKAVFQPKQIDSATLQREYWRLYERLFSWKGIVRRLVPSTTRLGPYMRAVLWAANVRYRGHVRARISPGIL